MEFQKVVYTVEDRIAFITLNSPKNFNALNLDLAKELFAAVKLAEEDPTVKVAVIRGAGKAFCAGGDLAFMKASAGLTGHTPMDDLLTEVSAMAVYMKQAKTVFIASVHGPVAGAGANIVFCCDYCIAAENAQFIQAFVNVALIPDTGGVGLLSKSVGAMKAAELALTGRPVGAREAQSLGFVAEVCAPEELEDKTMQAAKRFAAGPATSYAEIKRLLYEACFKEFPAYMEEEQKSQKECSMQSDFVEGVAAFIEKRKANFR